MNFRNYIVKDVDGYIQAADSHTRSRLEEFRKLVLASVPGAIEGVHWGVPFYMFHGVLAGFAPFKNHVSFGLVTVLDEQTRTQLEQQGYVTGKKTIQIRYDQPIPSTVIRKILKEKAEINEKNRRLKHPEEFR